MLDTLLLEQAQWIAVFQALAGWLTDFAIAITRLGMKSFTFL